MSEHGCSKKIVDDIGLRSAFNYIALILDLYIIWKLYLTFRPSHCGVLYPWIDYPRELIISAKP